MLRKSLRVYRAQSILALGVLVGVASAAPVHLDFNTGGAFAEELSFTLTNVLDPGTNIAFDSHSPSQVTLDDGFADSGDLLNFTSYDFDWDLGPGDYTFTVLDSFGDGGNGLTYELFVDGASQFSGTFPGGASEANSFTVPGEVPEPSSLGLLAIGLVGGMLWRKRRASANNR